MENSSGRNSLSSGNESECNGYLDKIVAINDSDMEDLISRDFEWKVRKYNDIKFAKEQFEEKCSANYIPEIRLSIASQFDFDMVKLICVLRNDPQIAGTSLEENVRKASLEEINAVERLESFSGIDALDSDKIREALERKNGQIYEIIKSWYNNQMDEFNKILEATPQSKMRNSIKREIMNRYDRRFEVITKGLIDYIKKDSTAAARLFNEYTDFVNRAYDAQTQWDGLVAGFGYVPITEMERKHELLEARESETLDRINKLVLGLPDSNDTTKSMEQIRSAYENLVSDHQLLKEEISSRIGEITTIIDKGTSMVRGLDLNLTNEADEKVKVVKSAQIGYLDSRIEDMRSSLARLRDFEDQIESHVLKYKDELGGIQNLIDNPYGGNLITVDQVKIQVIDLLSRFKKKIEESLPLTLIDPLRNGELKVSTRNELYSSSQDESTAGRNDTVVITGTTFRFQKKRIFAPALNLNFSVFYLIHKNRFNTYAVDNKPFSLSEFVDLLDYLVKKYSSDNMAAYVVLVSPTGFDRKIVEYLSGDHRLYLRNLFIFAMDPVTGNTFGNKPIPDPTISNIVKLQLKEERTYHLKKTINGYMDRFPEISLERIAEEQKITLESLREVTETLENEGLAAVEKKKDLHMIRRIK
ncbi:MAG: hypothetical protein M1344_02515 [Candidatus Thermoplasmatota archaeon]|nr:hypothetical protein [Candidatus Thermoplasmatota archaeon]